jgi:ribosomal protein S18 acetylase RimI-like enzyme
VRIGELDVRGEGVAAEVLALQRAAYRYEAELIGTDAIPPLRETLAELRACGERFLGAFVDERLAGFVSWKRDGDVLDIHRLAVGPAFFRRGIGAALVRAALAADPGAAQAIVQTGALNAPAKALYEREGFTATGEREVAPGLRVTLFERPLSS